MSQRHQTADDDLRGILERAHSTAEPTLDHAIDPGLLDAVHEDAERTSYAGADLAERYEAVIQALTARIDREPAFKRVAAAAFRERMERRIFGEWLAGDERRAAYRAAFVETIEDGVAADVLDERLLETFDLRELAGAIEPARDQLLEYMAMETLHQRYLLRVDPDGEPRELPQVFWLRVAAGLALEEDDPAARAREFYEVLSTLRFTPSTPTLFHSGTTTPQLSSCYLTTVEDDLEAIFDAYGSHAQLSKYSGGLGNDWTNLRAAGALISSTGVESTGVVPFLRISNDVTAAINRSGKRRGAACAYLAIWHADFPAFLDLKRNTGDERRRTPDMNTAAWIPDLFMERVAAGEEWTLFSPDEVPELHGSYGREFAEAYRAAEERAAAGELRQHETVDAAELWRTTLTRVFETGHPWITFKDPCNVRSPQDHVGTVHSSNLCTEITLNTSPEEQAVCNLGSLNLATHVDADGPGADPDASLDRELVRDTVATGMRMLDNVVDLCFYPTDEAARANRRHRPVGLGTMGFHDALMRVGVSMADEAAVERADRWQELVAHEAIHQSSKLAAERGAYESYEGSKWDRGLFPQDTVDELAAERGRPIPTERSERLDWAPVREHVAAHGMRNSNTMAIAPTATISTINGTTPSIEPIYSNLYAKSNMSGDFTVVNDNIVADLRERGLWDGDLVDELTYHDGSVQEIDRVPDALAERHRGAFEIDPRHQLALTAHRGTWIDQSISHNVFFPETDGSLLEDVYTTAWELGLKTTYYLRTLGASQTEKSTLDMGEYGRTQHRDEGLDADGSGGDGLETDGGRPRDDAGADAPEEGDDADRPRRDPTERLCTVDDPTCDACQ